MPHDQNFEIHKCCYFFLNRASLLTLMPQPAQAANLPEGLAAFTWILNGVTQAIENAINIIQCINPQPVAGLVLPVSIIFTESPSQIVLAVQGGDFDVNSTQTFGISGNYWKRRPMEWCNSGGSAPARRGLTARLPQTSAVAMGGPVCDPVR